eukprot:RCo052043
MSTLHAYVPRAGAGGMAPPSTAWKVARQRSVTFRHGMGALFCLVLGVALSVQCTVINRNYNFVETQIAVMFLASQCYCYSSIVLIMMGQKLLAPLPFVCAEVYCVLYYNMLGMGESHTKLTDQLGAMILSVFILANYVLDIGLILVISAGRRCHLALLGLLSVYLLYAVRGASKNSMDIGLVGQRMTPPSEFPRCPFPIDLFSYHSMIPVGWGNFLAGSRPCTSVPQFSSFVAPQQLTVSCPTTVTLQTDLGHFDGRFRPGKPSWTMPAKEFAPHPSGRNLTINTSAAWFEVTCGSSVNYHVQHVPKPEVVDWARRFPYPPAAPNVLFFMIDSLSRLHFMRRLQRTAAVLSRIHTEGAAELFQFFRYVSVGDDTKDNLPCFVNGYYNHSSYTVENRAELRKERYWWVEYKQRHGFATIYQNDICEDDLLYWMDGPGRHLDHNFVEWSCHPEYHHDGVWSNFVGPYAMFRHCIAGREVHQYQLDHLQQAWTNYHKENVGRAAYVAFEEGHEGSGEVVGYLDPDMAKFMQWMWDEGHLSDTVVVFVGDHGLHMGPLYGTRVGMLEHKLPVLHMLVPKPLLQRFPELRETLLYNQQLVASHWDLYATLRHFAFYPDTPDRGEPGFPKGPPWAKSLLNRLPRHRGCAELRIAFCNCVCGQHWDDYVADINRCGTFEDATDPLPGAPVLEGTD